MLLSPAQRLVEAQAALHAIQIGQGIQSVTDQNGESVRYTTANVTRLMAYIEQLKQEIAGTPTRRSGPIRPNFGAL